MSGKMTERGSYASVWDQYVTDAFPRIQAGEPHSTQDLAPWRVLNRTDSFYEWPGDEWGDRESASQMLDAALPLQGADVLCEFGAGSGRYTQLVFERFPGARIVSFDVSAEFERTLRTRFADEVGSGALETVLLGDQPFQVLAELERRDMLGRVDAFYSFDALVHVELHTLFMYWFAATRALRDGGILAMNVADATNELGFMKLASNAPSVYRAGGGAGGHFMWLSPEIVRATLTRLGFDVEFVPGNGRDLSVSAKLVDRDRSQSLLSAAGARYRG